MREAWPSPATGASLTDGLLADGERLVLTVASERLVVFGDGVETDRCELTRGQDVTVGLSPRRLRLAGPDDAAGGARRERGRGRPGAAAGPDDGGGWRGGRCRGSQSASGMTIQAAA